MSLSESALYCVFLSLNVCLYVCVQKLHTLKSGLEMEDYKRFVIVFHWWEEQRKSEFQECRKQ